MKLKNITGLGMLMSAAIGMLGASSAQAQVTFIGSGTAAGDGQPVQATATFSLNGSGHLVIDLINSYTGNTFGNADTLYGVFFNGASGLTVASVDETVGDVVWNPPSTTTTTVSTLTAISNWQLASVGGLSGVDGTQGGPANGLVSQGFAPPFNDGIASGSHNPYLQSELEITFNQGYNLTALDTVRFLYGTTVSTDFTIPGTGRSTPVPEASTVFAGALMLLPLGVGAIRALRKEKTLAPSKVS